MLQSKNYLSFLGILLMVIMSVVTNTSAQGTNKSGFKLSKTAIANLENGIKSDNPGLRRSSIELVGKYLIKESSEDLLNQLRIEDSEFIRMQIVKSLYFIGKDEFMKEIYEVATKDKDLKVREYALSVFSMMTLEKSVNLAENNIIRK